MYNTTNKADEGASITHMGKLFGVPRAGRPVPVLGESRTAAPVSGLAGLRRCSTYLGRT